MGHTASFSPMIISIFSISPISKKTVMNTMGMVAVLDLEERKETINTLGDLLDGEIVRRQLAPLGLT